MSLIKPWDVVRHALSRKAILNQQSAPDLHVVAVEDSFNRGKFRVDLRDASEEQCLLVLQHYDPERGWTLESLRRGRALASPGTQPAQSGEPLAVYLGLFTSPASVVRNLQKLLGVPVRLDRVSRYA
jgi:hypothetical protein